MGNDFYYLDEVEADSFDWESVESTISQETEDVEDLYEIYKFY